MNLYIALEKRTTGSLRRFQHLSVTPAVQRHIAQLGVSRGIQHRPGFLRRSSKAGRQFLQMPALHSRFQLRYRNPAHIHQHMRGICPHGFRLQQGLYIVIIIFQLENIQISGVRNTVAQIGQSCLPHLGKGCVHGLRPGRVQLWVAALLKNFYSLLICAGLQHLFHPFPGEKAVLHGTDPGRNRQIIGVLDFFCQDTASLPEQLFCHRSRSLRPLQAH